MGNLPSAGFVEMRPSPLMRRTANLIEQPRFAHLFDTPRHVAPYLPARAHNDSQSSSSAADPRRRVHLGLP